MFFFPSPLLRQRNEAKVIQICRGSRASYEEAKIAREYWKCRRGIFCRGAFFLRCWILPYISFLSHWTKCSLLKTQLNLRAAYVISCFICVSVRLHFFFLGFVDFIIHGWFICYSLQGWTPMSLTIVQTIDWKTTKNRFVESQFMSKYFSLFLLYDNFPLVSFFSSLHQFNTLVLISLISRQS